MLLMPEALAQRYLNFMRSGSFGLLGLVIAWKAYDYVFSPIFGFALRLLFAGLHSS